MALSAGSSDNIETASNLYFSDSEFNNCFINFIDFEEPALKANRPAKATNSGSLLLATSEYK